MDDFMLSNYYRNKHNNSVLRKMTALGVRQSVAQPLLEVDPVYLNGAFEQMKVNFGDMDTFLQEELGMGELEKNILRNLILMPKNSDLSPTILE